MGEKEKERKNELDKTEMCTNNAEPNRVERRTAFVYLAFCRHIHTLRVSNSTLGVHYEVIEANDKEKPQINTSTLSRPLSPLLSPSSFDASQCAVINVACLTAY